MKRFLFTAAFAGSFLAPSFALAADQTDGSQKLPHTGLWIKVTKGSEAFDPGTGHRDIYKNNDVLLVTKIDGDPGPFPFEVGDVILKVNGYPMFTFDQLAEEAEYYRHIQPRVRTLVVRDDKEARPSMEVHD